MARVDLSTLSRMTLTGDEALWVSMDCLDCVRQVAVYAGPAIYGPLSEHPPVDHDEIPVVGSLASLVLAAHTHVTSVHTHVEV
jgi:hypothetical protein